MIRITDLDLNTGQPPRIKISYINTGNRRTIDPSHNSNNRDIEEWEYHKTSGPLNYTFVIKAFLDELNIDESQVEPTSLTHLENEINKLKKSRLKSWKIILAIGLIVIIPAVVIIFLIPSNTSLKELEPDYQKLIKQFNCIETIVSKSDEQRISATDLLDIQNLEILLKGLSSDSPPEVLQKIQTDVDELLVKLQQQGIELNECR